jgi:hypothetical protein
MARDLVGTPQKVVLDGNLFYCMADADINDGAPRWAGTALPHSGGNMWQMILQTQEAAGVKIKCNSEELEILRALAEREDPFPMSYTNRAGDTYTTTGWITFDPRSNANGYVEARLIPHPGQNAWTVFIAG